MYMFQAIYQWKETINDDLCYQENTSALLPRRTPQPVETLGGESKRRAVVWYPKRTRYRHKNVTVIKAFILSSFL